jgi:hypothetical protein
MAYPCEEDATSLTKKEAAAKEVRLSPIKSAAGNQGISALQRAYLSGVSGMDLMGDKTFPGCSTISVSTPGRFGGRCVGFAKMSPKSLRHLGCQREQVNRYEKQQPAALLGASCPFHSRS